LCVRFRSSQKQRLAAIRNSSVVWLALTTLALSSHDSSKALLQSWEAPPAQGLGDGLLMQG